MAGSTIAAHFNSFFGDMGIDNIGSGTISATANWWKCHGGRGGNDWATAICSGHPRRSPPILSRLLLGILAGFFY